MVSTANHPLKNTAQLFRDIL